ncbi:protein mono-ADP-ribosyltransferase PARP14-like [Octopus sinensis]|uniref:Poly [ADP-ribose] polymerase n=1 Tax=Octopus sinensis TaxID=2607531 RepID=A0A7E6FB46_9MOLL|nr:protein mono-ADP-ribosyltransferase PARP14-like [Octopus sinensis]
MAEKDTASSKASLPGSPQEPSSVAPSTNVMSGRYDDIKINLAKGTISNVPVNVSVDVIVNNTNKNLQLNDGSLSKSILNAAGPQIQDECNQKYPQGISTSEIAITKGYNLNCENVFHLALPPWDENSSDSILANLTQIITTCLETAERMGAKILAFPILGAEMNYPIGKIPVTMFEAVKNYSNLNSSQIKVVYIVLPNHPEIEKAFDQCIQRRQKNEGFHSKNTTSSSPPLLSSQQEPSSVEPRSNVISQEYDDIKINQIIDSISNASVDVIVNSTNKELQLQKGSFSKYILFAAGSEIQDECNQKYPQGISTSEIAITKGYNLKCKNVFHLALPPWDENSSDSILANLTRIITTCLEAAERMGTKSLAFPILGAGTLNYPIENLPRTMYEAVKNYSDQNSSCIKDVYFVFPKHTEIVKKFDEYLQNKDENEGVINKQENEGFHSKDTASSKASLPGSQQEPSSVAPRTNVASGENAGINIQLLIDSISNVSVDVIVNSTNKNLELDSGAVSKSILFAAGSEIQDECNQKYPRGISTSEIAITKGYNLKCENVFHLALPPWDEYSSDLILANLTQIITICLHTAEKMGAKCLAFPIIGAGKLKYPIENLPGIMYEAVKNYSDLNSSQIKVVNFVVYPQDTEIVKKFREYLLKTEKFHSKDTASPNPSLPGPQQKAAPMTPRTNVASGENAGIEINLMTDSISNASVDVIVNSTNEELQLDSGAISKYILFAAGPQIQDECSQKYPQGISTSKISITKGYNLKCKNVFHLALPPWDENSSDSILANLTQIITICLEEAERMGAKSLAFPILGAEMKYPIEKLPGIMYEAVKNYADLNSSQIKDLYFVICPQDTEIAKEFEECLQNKDENEGMMDKQENEGFHSKDTASSNASLPGSQQEPSSMTPRTNETSREYDDIEINLTIGSISNVSVDVIVNSTNEELQLDSGAISKYILFAAGPQIQDECSQKYPQGISTSKIAITKGYNLKCKNVFHLALPPWDENSPDSILANLTQIITICLEEAERMGAKSLAFPILGAEMKYPIEKLPGIMYEAVKNYADLNSSQIKDVYFVICPQDTEIAKKFEECLQNKDENEGMMDKQEKERFHSKDDEDEEIEDNVSAGQKDVGVTLKFFAEYQNLDNAIETVKKEYDSLLTTEKIPFDVDLTESRKPNLKSIGTDHEVQISIRDKIEIHGRHSHVKNAKLDVQSLLMEYKEADEEIIFKDIAQWSYFDENNPENIRMFSDKENAMLEKAYSLGKRFLNLKKIKYDIKKMCFQHEGRKFKMKRKQNLRYEPIPDTWSPMEDEELIKIVPVTKGPEYDDIQATFRRNLPSYRIIKIERIQNKTLYQGYQSLKRKFEAENPNITNEVDGLWHGTAEGAVKGINKSGFNRSYCGRNGGYGKGVYFAKNIQYSADDNYSPPDHHKIKRIYQCSVLVGRMIQGHPGLKVLQDPYNSAVNNIQRPFIYVTFDDSQAYPNYLITFSN